MKRGTRGIHAMLLACTIGGLVIGSGCGDSGDEASGADGGTSSATGGSGASPDGSATGGTTSGGSGGTSAGGTSAGGTATTGGTSAGGTATTGGTAGTTAGGTTGVGGTTVGTGGTAGTGTCGATQCTNCRDDDGDGLIDSADQECTGAADNEEDSFATGIPGDNQDPKWQDCFFDGNSGAGDDGCRYHTDCITGDIPQTDPSCQVTQECIDFCMQHTPNGCDCFGCCDVTVDGVTQTFMLSPTCSLDRIDDPSACSPCTKSVDCSNTCGHCELCLGKTELPPDCVPTGTGGAGGSGGSGGTGPICPTPICPGDRTPCGLSCLPGCPADLYCVTGCCNTPPE